PQRNLAGARFTPARRIGDLDVADLAAVVADHGTDVVAVDLQVVQVGEESQVRRAVFFVHTVDHADAVGGRDEGVPRCAAHRFDEHGSADAVCRPGGVGQVLRPDGVLGRG